MDQQLMCPRCGNQLQYPGDRCQYCGAVFQQVWTVPQPAYSQPAHSQPVAQPVDQRNARWTPLRFVPPVLLVVLLVFNVLHLVPDDVSNVTGILMIAFNLALFAVAIGLALMKRRAAVLMAATVSATVFWGQATAHFAGRYAGGWFADGRMYLERNFFLWDSGIRGNWSLIPMLALLVAAVLLFVVLYIQRNPQSMSAHRAPMAAATFAPMPMVVPIPSQPVQPYTAPPSAASPAGSTSSPSVPPQPSVVANVSACSKCGAALQAGDQFCGECGAPM